MLERQDIDALLMGALYGELSPAESTRLEEHLAAHPQDRMVLDGLTRARQAIRDSHVLARQAEPPAAVSALILQEAARRANAPRSERRGVLARFFAGFTAFSRHPAMAGAAVVVLVAGVAGALYWKGNQDLMVEREASAPSTAAPPQEIAIDRAEEPARPEPSAGAGMPAPEGANENQDGYRAELADTAIKQQLEQGQASAARDERKSEGKDTLREKGKVGKELALRTGPESNAEAAKPTRSLDKVAEDRPPSDDKPRRQRGITVTTPDVAIKPADIEPGYYKTDTSSGDFARAPSKVAPGTTLVVPAAPATAPSTESTVDLRDQLAGRAQTGQTVNAVPPAPPPAIASDRGGGGGGGGVSAGSAGSSAGKGAVPTRADGKAGAKKKADAPSQVAAVPSAAPAVDPARAELERKNLAAAETLHRRLTTLVKGNKCSDAAKVANDLYARYPDYYAEFVQNDRAIKACKQYIDIEKRKRAMEKMKSRVNNSEYDAESPSPASDAK